VRFNETASTVEKTGAIDRNSQRLTDGA